MSDDAAKIVSDFVRLAQSNLDDPEQMIITDAQLAAAMSAAVKLYASRCEASASFPPPLNRQSVTATDVLVAVCEMIRVADVNLFDLSMWHGRPRPN